MFSSFIYFVAHVSTSFFFTAQQNSVRQLLPILLVHSSVGEHVCYFHLGEIMNNAAMNICVQIFLWTQSGIAGAYGNSMYDVQDTHTQKKLTLKKTSKNKTH